MTRCATRRSLAILIAIATALFGAVVPRTPVAAEHSGSSVGSSSIEEGGTTGAYRPLSPARILDTRPGEPSPSGQPIGKVGPDTSIEVQITGVGGVPNDGVVAVVLNLTIAQASGPGFVTAHPGGTSRPDTSNLNVTAAGRNAPNSVIVPVGEDGTVTLYTSGGGHLIADVFGYFEQADSATGGRLVGVSPSRVFDTRPPSDLPGATGKLDAGDTIEVKVTDTNGVPATGVSAVVLNVTAAAATAAGYVTVYPGDEARPATSNLHLSFAGENRPNAVIVPVSSTGTIKLFSESGAHLLADVSGYFTDGTAADSDEGLFTPIEPERLLDTRSDGPPVAAGDSIGFGVTGRAGIPADATGVALNLTAVRAVGAGFVTAWPSDELQPLASNLNVPAADVTIANLAVLPIGTTSGRIEIFTQGGAHLLADTAGYFTGGSSSGGGDGAEGDGDGDPPSLPADCGDTGRMIETADLGWTAGQEIRDELVELLDTTDPGDTVVVSDLYRLAPGGVTVPDGVSIVAASGGGFQLLDIAGASGPWVRLGSCTRWHNVTLVDTEPRGPEEFVRTNNKTALFVGGENVVISQSLFDANTKTQLELRNVSNVRIDATHFDNGYFTVLIRSQTQDVEITDSLFSNSYGDGIKTSGGGSSDVRRMLVSNTVFEDNARDGIDTTGGWRDSLVRDTIFRRNGVSGMDVKSVYNDDGALHPDGSANSNIRVVRSEFIDQPNGIVLTTLDPTQTLTEQSDAVHLVHDIRLEDSIVENNGGSGRGLLVKDAHSVSWEGIRLLGGSTMERTYSPEENRSFGGVVVRPPIPTSNFDIGGQDVSAGPARGANDDLPFDSVGPR